MALRLPSLSSLTCIQDVGILDDGDVEDSETFTLSLSSSNNNIVYSNRNATVTIVDNDGTFSDFADLSEYKTWEFIL